MKRGAAVDLRGWEGGRPVRSDLRGLAEKRDFVQSKDGTGEWAGSRNI